ncbi:hypothetical protein V8F33_011352 [Rhypophila sp. PSN 637]
MAENETPGQIASFVFRAISAFEALLFALGTSSAGGATAASHFARFKLWVGSLGAHRSSGGRSLEYRLRDASTIKGQIVSLLQDLNESVAQGLLSEQGGIASVGADNISSDPLDAELEEYFRDEDDAGAPAIIHTLEDIGHVVDCLLRLSVTIRNPAPHDHFKSRTGSSISSLYEEWDIKHAREKFPKAAGSIVERLGKASAQRRQYLKYREDHTNRLAEGLVSDTATSEFGGSVREKATTIASSIPSYLKEGEAGTPSSSAKLAGFSDSESIASRTSYAASSAQTGQLRVPPLPKESGLGPFKCPYCCLILAVDSKREWKKHVHRDLRPYVCTEAMCTKPDQQYQRRSDWLHHMQREHWKTWNCPFGCPDTFHSPKSFGEHVEKVHPSEKGAERLDTLQGLSGHVDLSKAEGQCPLCDEFRISSAKLFGAHVGTHLEQLALFALPNSGDDAGSDENTDSSDMAMMKESDDESPDSSVRYEDGSENEHHPGTSLEALERGSSDLNDDGLGNSDDRNNGEEIHWPFSGESGEPPDDNSDSDEGEDRTVRLMADGSLFSDIVYTEFNHKLNLERFQENCIVQGKLRVSDLIDRVIDRHGIVQGNHHNVALFFMDRIHGSSNTPVCNIGLVSGGRVKVLCPVDMGSGPSTLDTTLAERIRFEMSKARKECGEYTKAAALKQESLGSLYGAAKQAVSDVLHSLGELYPDGDLMTCWKEEMIDQAHSVRRSVDKAYYEHMDVVDSGNSSKAAAGA